MSSPEQFKCPDYLRNKARAAWEAIVPKLERHCGLLPIEAYAVGHLCAYYGEYLEAREIIKRGDAPDGEIRKYQEKAKLYRLETRWWAAEFFMIPRERIYVAPLNDDGDDKELATWSRASDALDYC